MRANTEPPPWPKPRGRRGAWDFVLAFAATEPRRSAEMPKHRPPFTPPKKCQANSKNNRNPPTKMNKLERQKLKNAVLLLAYVKGRSDGWYAICQGEWESGDYALLLVNSGDVAMHAVKVLLRDGHGEDEEYLDELEDIAAEAEKVTGDRPTVATVTAEDTAAAAQLCRDDIRSYDDEDGMTPEKWATTLFAEYGKDWPDMADEEAFFAALK